MIRTTPGTPIPNLPIKTAARYLGVSATPIRKGLAAGVIPDLSLATVDELSRRAVLNEVESVTGAPVPVLRLAPAQRAVDAPGAPSRTFTGYRHGMSGVDFLASCDRWWPTSGRDLVLAAQSMLVACGSICVGWIDVDGVKTVDDSGLLHYNARIVARLSAADDSVLILDHSSPNAEIAQLAVGLRVLGGSGGSITGLDASADTNEEVPAA